jgi:hypothetical protein
LFPEPTEIPSEAPRPAALLLQREPINFAEYLKAFARLSIIGEWAGKAAHVSRPVANCLLELIQLRKACI